MSEQTPMSARVRVRRAPERGRYDRATVDAVLDAGAVGHLAFVEDGRPVLVPFAYGRAGDTLYLHGSTGSRAVRAAAGGEVSFAVTLLDGLVLARSVFHHSMNYRSVVLFGTARLVTDPDERVAGLRAVSEHLAPGQWAYARRPNRRELAATAVLALALDEVAAKTRTGGPVDEEEDLALPVWAGVLPLPVAPGPLTADAHVPAGVEPPEHLRRLAAAAGPVPPRGA